jgi:hypothetical protein
MGSSIVLTIDFEVQIILFVFTMKNNAKLTM